MAVQDIRSNLIFQFVGGIITVNGGTALTAGVIDTAAYELGVMFSFQVLNFGDGANTATIQESDLPTTGFTSITDAEQLIGTGNLITTPITPVPSVTGTGTVSDPFVAVEERMDTLGVIGNKRFLKVLITNVGGADTTAYSVFATQKAEDMPTQAADA